MNAGKTSAESGAYTLLRDKVAETDAFGSHQRVAAIIARSIIANPSLRVIGLLGPWGSGKSTVVGFVENELAKEKKTHVFTYDAWLHQADPPRRSFLESFINFLVLRQLTEKEKWTERVDQLNGRIQDTVITKTPQLTMAGRAILIALLGVPVGWSLIFKASVTGVVQPTLPTGWQLWWGSIFVTLPLIVASIVYVAWRPTWNLFSKSFWEGRNWNTHRGDRSREAIFSLFLNRQTQTTKDRITKDPEPTSIEFQKTFRELMAAVVDLRHRFLIVIDNLDRLPEDEAIALWSTIRSFFLGSELSGHELNEALLPTIVLPVDMKAIKRLYNDKGDDDRAYAFLEKTFDATFQVNRPVFTGWRKYLQTQMTALFGSDLESDWVYITSRILDRALVETPDTPITPRRINSLVNRIGTQWMLRHDEQISFSAIAYYCIFQAAFDENVLAAVQNPKVNMDVYDPDWTRGVAAIHFGVSPAEANEVLLDVPIRSAIERGAGDEFRELTSAVGFDEQIVRICASINEPLSDPVGLLRTVALLGTSSAIESPALDEAWRQLRRALPKTAQWPTFDDHELSAVKVLLDRGTARQNAEILKVAVEKALSSTQSYSEAPVINAKLARLWNWVVAAHPDVFGIIESIDVGTNPQAYLVFVAACVDNHEVLARVKAGPAGEDIAKALVSDLSGTDRDFAANRLRGTIRSAYTIDLSTLAETAGSLLGSNGGSVAAKALLALGLLRGHPTAEAHTKTLLENARIQAVLLEGLRTSDIDCIARSLALLLGRRPGSIPNPPQQWASAIVQMPELVEQTELALKEMVDDDTVSFAALVECGARDDNLRALTSALLTRWLDAGRPTGVSPDMFLSKMGHFKAGIGRADYSRFLRDISSHEGFWDALRGADFPTVAWPLLTDLADLGGDLATCAMGVLHGHLLVASEADWTNAILGPTEWSEAAILYAKQAGPPDLSGLLEPLAQSLPRLMDTGTSAAWSRWFALSELLPERDRGVLMRSVRDRILHVVGSVALPVLQAGGRALLSDGDFVEKADEVCRGLFPALIREPGGAAYLNEYGRATADCFLAAKADTQGVLLDMLKVDAGSDDPKAEAGNLLSSWGTLVDR